MNRSALVALVVLVLALVVVSDQPGARVWRSPAQFLLLAVCAVALTIALGL